MVITYNFQENVVPEKLTKTHIQEAENEIEEAENASSSFPISSNICRHSSPNKLKANPFPLGDGFAFKVYFRT